jgi:hypothetical protein
VTLMVMLFASLAVLAGVLVTSGGSNKNHLVAGRVIVGQPDDFPRTTYDIKYRDFYYQLSCA